MKELFQWVPWFRELAEAVGKVRQEGLVEAANNIDWGGQKCAVLAHGEERADPLTFFYHLAAIAKSKKRETVYASVAKAFGIKSDLDYSWGNGFIFPTPPGLAVKFNNTGADPRIFWEMFDQARGQGGTSYGTDLADTFTKTLQVKGVAVPKLTQVLFLINPRAFLPFDAQAVLPLAIGTFKKHPAKMSWDEYVEEMGRVRAAFPGCHCYEINVIGYLWTSEKFPRKGNGWYQIGTSEDGWQDFRENHWVHHGGEADTQDDRLDEPKPGDVILVRSGTRKGHGIGIVYRNDHKERSHPNGRIHVLWVNKEQAALAAKLPPVGFSEADRTVYDVFHGSAAYSPTLDLLQRPQRPQPPELTEKTVTLYAQFYRPLVAWLRERGVHPPGNPWQGRWRSFQTGYPDALYGTELDGGKAKVFLSFRGPAANRRFRALRQHRKEIDGKVNGTVLWLDETQGSWKHCILLERDEAFRLRVPDKDLEATTRKWMGDNLLALRDAVQSYLDQVMRVGPRSLASLIQSLKDRRLRFPRETVTNYILALQTKRFAILTGISGTGKTKIAVAVAQHFRPARQAVVTGTPDDAAGDEPLDNYVVVPVRPDWVDNRGLLGYLNPLTNEYSTTPFLDLLLRARAEEERAADAGEKPHPFFVILDEMNLARVEHYFSDFLSALESGEAIPLHENEAIESGESESGPQVPRKLEVPGNVLFTGTVNVDETTYMFSPKVLDRAFTIEFDQVDLRGFAEGAGSEDESGLNLDAPQQSLDLLPSGSSENDDWKPSREDWVEFSEETGEHQKALLRLHDILEAQHRHFGYRVANEIARFVNLAREQAKDTKAAVEAAFDLALLQKVLPKFHGTQQELQSLLEEVFHFAVHGRVPKKDQTVELADWRVVKGRLVGGPKTDSDNPEAADTGTRSPAYPRTGAKVLRMLNRLRDRGFTSFIE